jgi:hypothetical protein
MPRVRRSVLKAGIHGKRPGREKSRQAHAGEGRQPSRRIDLRRAHALRRLTYPVPAFHAMRVFIYELLKVFASMQQVRMNDY